MSSSVNTQIYDVITVGSATMDACLTVESELIKIKHESFEEDLIAYPAGSKLLVQDISFHVGGGGTNTAAAFSRLGMKTAYLGKLGNDENGKSVLELLKKEKVDFIGLVGQGKTGYSVIFDSMEGDRTVLTYKGNNDLLRPDEIRSGKIRNKLKARCFYFSSMMNDSFKSLELLSEYAKKNKILLAFNPSEYLCKKGPAYLSNVLGSANCLILNKEEAEYLTGFNAGSQMHGYATHNELNMIKLMLKSLFALIGGNISDQRSGQDSKQDSGREINSIKDVVITDGKNGVFAFDGKQMYTAVPHKVKVAEPTGAGDAFASTFFAARAKGKGVKDAITWGMINAESVIQHIGPKEILLSKSQIHRALKSKPVKVTVLK